MSAALIDGNAIAADIREKVKQAAETLRAQYGAAPELAVMLVGEDPASQIYVRNKVRDTEQASMRSHEIRLPAETTE
ncbi:MAG: tetrahydrofolate dehydrogenase/cyclohydrolase catalytic domain-containing protein, partial [Hyphomonadaceae bacterium]